MEEGREAPTPHAREGEVGWAGLPWVPLVQVLAHVAAEGGPARLVGAGLACRAWYAAASDNGLWRHLCQRDWRLVRRPPAVTTLDSSYKVLGQRMDGWMGGWGCPHTIVKPHARVLVGRASTAGWCASTGDTAPTGHG